MPRCARARSLPLVLVVVLFTSAGCAMFIIFERVLYDLQRQNETPHNYSFSSLGSKCAYWSDMKSVSNCNFRKLYDDSDPIVVRGNLRPPTYVTSSETRKADRT